MTSRYINRLKRVADGHYEFDPGFGVSHHVMRARGNLRWVVVPERAGTPPHLSSTIGAARTLKLAQEIIKADLEMVES